MNKTLFLSLFLLLGLTHRSYAAGFSLRPVLSLMGSYTVTQDYPDVRAGVFEVHSRKLNLGSALTNKWYLRENWFLNTGIRYNQYQTVVNDQKQAAASLLLAPVEWKEEHDVFAIPIQFGKNFITPAGNEGDFFIGLSLGTDITSEGKSKTSGSFRGGPDTRNIINQNAKGIRLIATFYPTADIGVHYHPFRGLPRWGIGVLCSVQPVKTKPFASEGLMQNLATGASYAYSIRNRERFMFNGAFMLSYAFGPLKVSARDNDPFKCPE